ncbi:MAG: leucyl/phenylalanyl-tRNA--protein transferase [Melioribacteraceae bacterium]|nr:leucyl/phenylalanyl-tRNA--protein transferase [Melioribacteraceae bacterium]
MSNREILIKQRAEKILQIYAQGAFPMGDSDTGKIEWFYPEIRTIIPLDNYIIPRSLKKFLASSNFEFRYDTSVFEVIDNCSHRESTWISPQLMKEYKGLYKIGALHSVEVFSKNELVGGLYGIGFRGAFFGESMFSKVSQASKAALVALLIRLNQKGYSLLDVQFLTDHLKMFGALEISLSDYNFLLEKACEGVDIRF